MDFQMAATKSKFLQLVSGLNPILNGRRDFSLLQVMVMLLEVLGCEVVALATMTELQQYPFPADCSPERQPTLFLIDQNLPGGRGLDFIEQKLQSGECRCGGRCMAVMSGALTDAELTRVQAIGCHHFEKPIMFDDLEAWLASLKNQGG